MDTPTHKAALEARLDAILLEIRSSEERLVQLRTQATSIIEGAKEQIDAKKVSEVRSRLGLAS